MKEIIIKAIENVINLGIANEKYYEYFCLELEKANIDENKHDYCSLFEEALYLKEII